MNVWFSFCPDSSKTVRTLFKLSGQFSNCPDSFKTVWMVLKLYIQCLRTFYMSQERFTLFFLHVARAVYAFFLMCRAKSIRVLRPENFRAWKAAIRKFSGFCASAGSYCACNPFILRAVLMYFLMHLYLYLYLFFLSVCLSSYWNRQLLCMLSLNFLFGFRVFSYVLKVEFDFVFVMVLLECVFKQLLDPTGSYCACNPLFFVQYFIYFLMHSY